MSLPPPESELDGSLYSEEGVHLEEQAEPRFCDFFRYATPLSLTTIPWADVLSATLHSTHESERQSLDITYVRHLAPEDQAAVRSVTKTVLLPSGIDSTAAQKAVKLILDRAYKQSQYCKRILILVNPFSGKGNGSAERKYNKHIKPVFEGAQCEVTVTRTTHKGHAVEIARDIDIDKFDVVACCSGDGVPHEVFNGLAKRSDARKALAKMAVVQLPCGSANGMSWNLFNTGTPSLAALRLVKSFRTPLDLVSITHQSLSSPDNTDRTMSFLTQSVGVIADCDLGTEHLRFLGESRFAIGLVWAILTKRTYPCDIAIAVEEDDKERIRENVQRQSEAAPYYLSPDTRGDGAEGDLGLPALQFGTVKDDLPEGWKLVPYEHIGNFYCGNVIQVQRDSPFFPMVLPSDGMIDLVTINGNIPTGPALAMLDDCPKNKLFDNELVSYRKVKGYRLIPRNKTGYIAIDGESIPHAGFQAEVHHKLATTLTITGKVFEGPGIPTKSMS